MLLNLGYHPQRILSQNFDLNSHGKHQKTYLSLDTDFTHMIDVIESLIIGNRKIDQNVELE